MFRRVDGLLPVTSGDFMFARRIYSRALSTLPQPLRTRLRAGLTFTRFWLAVRWHLDHSPRSHRFGTLHTGSRISRASQRALRAWSRSTCPSTLRKRAAKCSYSDPGSGVALRYNERWGSPEAQAAWGQVEPELPF